MSLLQVFSEMTTQRSGFGQNSCAADEQACVFGSFEFNKHSVLKGFMIYGLNFQTVRKLLSVQNDGNLMTLHTIGE